MDLAKRIEKDSERRRRESDKFKQALAKGEEARAKREAEMDRYADAYRDKIKSLKHIRSRDLESYKRKLDARITKITAITAGVEIWLLLLVTSLDDAHVFAKLAVPITMVIVIFVAFAYSLKVSNDIEIIKYELRDRERANVQQDETDE